MFLILWSVAGQAKLYDDTHDNAFRFAVVSVVCGRRAASAGSCSAALWHRTQVCVTLLPLTGLPVLLWAARQELRPNLAWAMLLSATTACLIPIGVYVLLVGGVREIRAVCGALFVVFGSAKLWLSVMKDRMSCAPAGSSTVVDPEGIEMKERLLVGDSPRAGSGDSGGDGSGSDRAVSVSTGASGEGLAGDASPRVDAVTVRDTAPRQRPAATAVSSGRRTGLWRVVDYIDAALVPISPVFSRNATAAIMLSTGAVSGLFGGMLGTGGPPQIVAFAQLQLAKDRIRGIKVIATTVSNVLRLLSFAVAGGDSLRRKDAWAYVGVTVGCVLGTAIGSYLRGRFDTEGILRGLYVILILSAATMFNVLKNGGALAAYLSSVVAYVVVLVVARQHWAMLVAAYHRLRSVCARSAPRPVAHDSSFAPLS
jgi:uncharacterized membrane protein YfcA